MGVGTILRTRAIVLVATGAGKAGAIKATVEGLVTTRVPASLLQLHGDVEVFLDRAAGSMLTITKARRHEGAKTNLRR
jgi:glucosamine-6-phosphate deaminase